MTEFKNRRFFLKKFFTIAGFSLIPTSSAIVAESLVPSKTVEFITHFPERLSLSEYRRQKTQFENKDKVTTLISTFKKSGKMLNENFNFHYTYSVWRVEFKSEEHFREWMALTEELESHLDEPRENAGFRLEVRSLS